MKNTLLQIILVLTFLVLSSCKKIIHEKEISQFEIKTDQISKDASFKNIIELENNLCSDIEKIMNSKNMHIESFLKLIENIKIDSKTDIDFKNKLVENNMPELYNKLSVFRSSFGEQWKILENKYNRLSSNEINVSSNKYFENNQFKKIYSFNKTTFSINNNYISRACGWGYSLCLAGATAGAILCHAACISGTAGFGAPACVILCGTIQVSIGVACISSYCDEN